MKFRRKILILILLAAALLMHFSKSPILHGLEAVALLGAIAVVLIRREAAAVVKTTVVPEPRDPETSPLIARAAVEVDESLEKHDLSMLGASYRRDAMISFEKVIDDIVDNAVKLVRSHLSAHTVAVFFPRNDGGYELRRHWSQSDLINPAAVVYPGKGVLGSFLKDGLKQLRISDILSDSQTLHYYTRDAGVRSLLASPIIVGGSERGIIIADSTTRERFSDEDHAFLSVQATLLGQAVYYAYLYNQHRLDHVRLAAMSSAENHFFKGKKLPEVLDKLIEIITSVLRVDRVTLALRQHESDIAIVERAWGRCVEGLQGLSFDIHEKSLAGIIFGSEKQNFCLMRNVSEEHYEVRYVPAEPQCAEFRSFLAFRIGVGEAKGVIILDSLQPDAFGPGQRELMDRLVHSASLAIEKIALLETTENMAIRDGLTGLYNHREFQKRLKESITGTLRANQPLSLVLCDIDHFKKLNDNHGHRFGDFVLKHVSAKLGSSIREGLDSAARYGGEEFTLILFGSDLKVAAETADRIRKEIADMPFTSPLGKEVRVTMSFGVAQYGAHANTPELIITRADKALYEAKENGRNRVEVCPPGQG